MGNHRPVVSVWMEYQDIAKLKGTFVSILFDAVSSGLVFQIHLDCSIFCQPNNYRNRREVSGEIPLQVLPTEDLNNIPEDGLAFAFAIFLSSLLPKRLCAVSVGKIHWCQRWIGERNKE